MAPFILSFTRISRPGPFAEKQPQNMFPPPCFTVANFRLAWTCTGLSRGTRLALQDLSPWRRSVLLMVGFVTLVPALCRSFTRSPRVVLGFLLTVLVIILTPRGEILHGAPDRGRLSVVLYVFHFLIIAPAVDFVKPSCLPIADCLPSLVPVYNFVSAPGPQYYPGQQVYPSSPSIIVPTPQQPPPAKREKKPIRIRDPNQGGRDITEEIMAGGTGSRNPTPPVGRPSSTPTPPQVRTHLLSCCLIFGLFSLARVHTHTHRLPLCATGPLN
ncbi:unnamed protein product [Oncorhynchus mykiss]|uniref:Uncharacterized protein n=1 Tax=Oncorhynchus mykiss TaxID=8022 RepID=A0A060XK78_ONCMY|nr:unnamed protein product [Oncorhynchus mykiss]